MLLQAHCELFCLIAGVAAVVFSHIRSSPSICLFHFSNKPARFRRKRTSLSTIASRVKSVRAKMHKNYFKSPVWSLRVRSSRTWPVFQWYLVGLIRLCGLGVYHSCIRWVQVAGFFSLLWIFLRAYRLEKMDRELLAGRRRRRGFVL